MTASSETREDAAAEASGAHGPEGAEAELRVTAQGEAAGGWPAISKAMGHVRRAGLWRGVGLLMKVNQADGFDCPGCAWPEPEHRAMAEFCENGAKAIGWEADRRRAGPELFARWPIARLWEQSDLWLGETGRLTHPLVRREGSDRYEAIGWDEALALVAGELRALGSPDEAVFYTSGRTSNEAAFLYQLLARQLGTNNLPDCSNLCHESSGVGLTEAIGVGKGTVQLSDFEAADLILVMGQNPGTNHPRMLSTLQEAARRGARIVSVNPLREAGLVRFKHPQEVRGLLGSGTPLASLHVPVRIGGDVALLAGVIKAVLEEEARRPGEVLDHAFVREHTDGFEALAAAVAAEPWEALVADSGVAEATMRELAGLYVGAKAVIAAWAMGLTQHEHGVANVQMVTNLLLLRGNVGRPGAGLCPVRGHSNVQGDRTMGIWERPPEAFLAALEAATGVRAPRAHGVSVVEAIEAMASGRTRVFMAMGGNFYSASPDSARTAEALRRCRLTVHVSTKLNRSHLVPGRTSLILPCLGRTERDVQGGVEQVVSVEDSMGLVHASRGRAEPASEHLCSEPAIVAGIGAALFGAAPVDWPALGADYGRVRGLVARVVPGFEDFDARLRRGGFALPNAARQRVWDTETGRARFTVHPVPRRQLGPGELLMMTVRSHDQYNTTIYGLDDRYRGVYGGRRVVFMHPADLEARGLRPGDRVDLASHYDGTRREVRGFTAVAYEIPRGCVATYFPEANPLVPLGRVAARSLTPISKSVVVTVAPSAEPSAT